MKCLHALLDANRQLITWILFFVFIFQWKNQLPTLEMNSIIYKKIWPNVKATDLGHSSYSHVFAFALLIVPCVLNFQLRKKQEQTDSVIQNVKPSGHPSTGGRGLRNKRPNRGVEHRLVLLLQWHFSLWVQYTRHVGCFGWFFLQSFTMETTLLCRFPWLFLPNGTELLHSK